MRSNFLNFPWQSDTIKVNVISDSSCWIRIKNNFSLRLPILKVIPSECYLQIWDMISNRQISLLMFIKRPGMLLHCKAVFKFLSVIHKTISVCGFDLCSMVSLIPTCKLVISFLWSWTRYKNLIYDYTAYKLWYIQISVQR